MPSHQQTTSALYSLIDRAAAIEAERDALTIGLANIEQYINDGELNGAPTTVKAISRLLYEAFDAADKARGDIDA